MRLNEYIRDKRLKRRIKTLFAKGWEEQLIDISNAMACTSSQ